jgi:hypothetical protein
MACDSGVAKSKSRVGAGADEGVGRALEGGGGVPQAESAANVANVANVARVRAGLIARWMKDQRSTAKRIGIWRVESPP